MSPEMTDPPPTDGVIRTRGLRAAVAFGIAVAMVVLYVLSLVAVHVLARSSPPIPPLDFSKIQSEASVVQVRIDDFKPVTNRLSVNVLVSPKDSLYDKDFGFLTTDAVVRLYPDTNLGDLSYPIGKAPAQVSTTLVAHGDPGNWPFDSYRTEVVAADVFTGTGHDRVRDTAIIDVVGKIDGWDASVQRVRDDDDPPDGRSDVILTLHRAKGPMIFDLGLCLILIALPVLALIVAIPMARGTTSFLPPFATWYAAMLFSVVPLRNFLPGAPPPGSWIDQAVVLWVLIALVVAMALFVFAWMRQRDRRTPNSR